MILKICDLDNDNVWMYDNLSTVRSNEKKHTKKMSFLYDQERYFPAIDTVGLDSSPEETVEYLEVLCRTIYGKEFTIAFKGNAYLCNDNNKTLEVIRWNP